MIHIQSCFTREDSGSRPAKCALALGLGRSPRGHETLANPNIPGRRCRYPGVTDCRAEQARAIKMPFLRPPAAVGPWGARPTRSCAGARPSRQRISLAMEGNDDGPCVVSVAIPWPRPILFADASAPTILSQSRLRWTIWRGQRATDALRGRTAGDGATKEAHCAAAIWPAPIAIRGIDPPFRTPPMIEQPALR